MFAFCEEAFGNNELKLNTYFMCKHSCNLLSQSSYCVLTLTEFLLYFHFNGLEVKMLPGPLVAGTETFYSAKKQ